MVWALLTVTLVAVTALLGAALLARWLRASRAATAREEALRVEQGQELETLRRLAGRNRAILQHAMDGFFVLGEDYRFREVNDAFCRMTGYSAAELRSLKMTDLEVSQPVADVAQATYWRTGLHHFATAHRHKQGHLVQLESCVMALRDGDAKVLVGFARDVTERVRAEQALRESEAEYRTLVEMSRDLIWSADLDGRWTFVNNAARTIYGYEPDEMVGRPLSEFAAPERRESMAQVLAELRAGKPRLRFDTEHIRKDGSRALLSVNASPIYENGRVAGITGTAADVSERRQAEDRLRAAHARFESLVARMPLGYIVWSKDFRALEWNRAAQAIFGYTADEVFGRAATELIVPAESRDAFARMCEALLAGDAPSGDVLVNRRHDGEKIRCEWYNTVLPDALGGVHAVATLVRDVSERERLEAQLRQSQKLESLGVLAGGVAHDFNNLLVGILGNASLAAEQAPADSPIQKLLSRVVAAGQRATELTQRMLAYAGRASCAMSVLDLGALVREMAEFATAAVPKNVELRIHIAEGLPLVLGDSGQIQQVVMNLLINAAEATGAGGGQVSVTLWTEALDAGRIARDFPQDHLKAGSYVCVEVSDNGCGMSPEILSRIFDPFFTTKFAGRGLGLSAILGIVKAHHAAVTVTSTVGVGSVFRVYFPVAMYKLKPGVVARRGPGLPRGATVLVIDDEAEILEVVEAVLSSRGINVLTAQDGVRGLEVFRREADAVDVVLLDMNMPGLNGEAVFTALRAERPDVKIVLSTGYSEQEAAAHFAGAPLAGFVHKPYTASTLVDKIGAALVG
jgi:PAS domain S-box-containing protein